MLLNYISKKINNVFNWIYTTQGYYFLKSGLFIDNSIKFIFHKFNKNLHFFYGLIFSDFFIINNYLNNLFFNWSRFNLKLLDLKKNNNFYGVKQTLLVVVICFIFLLFIIL